MVSSIFIQQTFKVASRDEEIMIKERTGIPFRNIASAPTSPPPVHRTRARERVRRPPLRRLCAASAPPLRALSRRLRRSRALSAHFIYVYIYIYICMYIIHVIYIYIYMHIHVTYIYIYMHKHVYIYIYIYIYFRAGCLRSRALSARSARASPRPVGGQEKTAAVV